MKNFIGYLIVKAITTFEGGGNFVDYLIKDGSIIYKYFLSFNITIGKYRFLRKDDYYKLKLEQFS